MRARLVLLLAAPLILVNAPPSVAEPTIFRCEVNGAFIYADRPCGANPEQYVPDAERVSVYQPVEPATPSRAVRSARPTRPAASRSRETIAAAQARQEAECERVLGGLRDLRARMRSGYRAAEGERLKARLARLETRRRSLHCS